MSTLPENIEKIRRNAILGTDVRMAIGDAMEQINTTEAQNIDAAVTAVNNRISTFDSAAAGRLTNYQTYNTNLVNGFNSSNQAKINDLAGRINQSDTSINQRLAQSENTLQSRLDEMRIISEQRALHMRTEKILSSESDYLLIVENAS